MRPIANILFDWSGTLVDDLAPVIDATNVVLVHCGRPVMTREGFLREFELPFGKFYERLVPGVPLESLEPVFHAAFARSEQKATPLPHALGFLEFCRRSGRQCFVLSSAHPPHLAAQADEFGMTRFFERIYAGVRDKTERIHHILEAHGLDPAATAFVGDMTHDIETARHGGVRSVAVLTGYQSAATLAAADPDVLVRDLAHLESLMRGGEPAAAPADPRPGIAVERSHPPTHPTTAAAPSTAVTGSRMPADTIHVSGLRVPAWIGVSADERAQPQSLVVSLELTPARGLAGLGDDLSRTIDYAAVAEGVRAVAAAQKRRLIETLAEETADALLAAHPLRRVTVEVRKFILPHCDHVAVRVTKERED